MILQMIIDVASLCLTLATLGVCITILIRLEQLARRRKYVLKKREAKAQGGSI